MIKLSKIRAVKRLAILFSCVAAITTGIFFATKQVENPNVNATGDTETSESYMVNISAGEEIPYGDETWFTHRFTVATTDGNVTGFCAIPHITVTPTTGPVEAQLLSDSTTNQQIKLLIYAATADASNTTATTFMNDLYSWLGSNVSADSLYAYVHATIGWIFAGDLTGFSPESNEPDQIKATAFDIGEAITNNTEIWNMAKDYKLYSTVGGGDSVQTVVWIEAPDDPEPEYSISTSATDIVDGDKYIEVSTNGSFTARILDTINYCAVVGETYTIQGTLVYPTGEPVIIDGHAVTSVTTDTPTEDCSTVIMTFPINIGEGLEGKNLVVYETLMSGTEVLASHNDPNDANQTVTVVSMGTTASDKISGTKLVEASKKATIVDTIDYCLRAGTEFTIEGVLMDKATGEALSINGEGVSNTITFTPAEENCGTTTMAFEFDASGLTGKEIVVFESVYQNNAPVISHEDINDAAQTIYIASLATTATDKVDGDNLIIAKDNVAINDHIKYCLMAENNFVITGTLMNKATGEPVLVNGQPVTQSLELTPENNCGEVDMEFGFDATGMGGTEIVVFETAFLKTIDAQTGEESYQLVASHEDLEDEAQTISVIKLEKKPETGFVTASNDFDQGGPGGLLIVAIPAVLAAGGYAMVRLRTRRRVFGARR